MTTRQSISQLRVADAMHAGIITCSPHASVREVARTMADARVHCVAVYADVEGAADGHLWGIVTSLDLVGAVDGDPDEHTAGETAASPVVTTSPNETLERAAQLMREYSTTHLVVVDPADGRPAGVLSTLDVAHAVAGTA